MGTVGYLEHTKEKEKGKVDQLDMGNEKDQYNSHMLQLIIIC